MSSVPIVQGVAVDPHQKMMSSSSSGPPVVVAAVGGDDYGTTSTTTYHQQQQQYEGMLHTKQPNQFRDVFWAILFVGHFIPLVLYAIYSMANNDNNGNDDNAAQQWDGTTPITIGPHLVWLSMTALASIGLSSLSLEGMMRHAEILVKISLIFSVGFSGLLGIMGLLSGQILMAVLGFLSFVIGYVTIIILYVIRQEYIIAV